MRPVGEPSSTEKTKVWLPAGVPARLGQYELVRPLGRGGMGMVFEASQLLLRQRVALKVLRPALNRALVDAWAMTSLEEHAGRPDVEPWLRGWQDAEGPQCAVVWREHLPVRVEFIESKSAADELLPFLCDLVTDGMIETQDAFVVKTAIREEPV